MFEIIPDNWARDVGPTWIDEGVLLMRSDSGMQLVGVSFSEVLGPSHRVQIFVRNDDLRHLIEHPSEITSIANNAELGVRKCEEDDHGSMISTALENWLGRQCNKLACRPGLIGACRALDSWWNWYWTTWVKRTNNPHKAWCASA